MSELKVGFLALVVGYKNVAQNLGKIVTLGRFVKKGEMAITGPATDDLWVIVGEGVGYTLGSEVVIGSEGLSAPNHLMPINPEQDPLEITEKEQEYAR